VRFVNALAFATNELLAKTRIGFPQVVELTPDQIGALLKVVRAAEQLRRECTTTPTGAEMNLFDELDALDRIT
jgi:hypothetical protein